MCRVLAEVVYTFVKNLIEMNIEKLYENPKLVDIEETILSLEEHPCKNNDNEIERLFLERKKFLDAAFPFNNETSKLLRTFNESLRSALVETYEKTKEYYDKVLRWNDDKTFRVESKLTLGEYPALHPIQTERSHDIWNILSYGGYDNYYDLVGINDLFMDKDCPENINTLDYFLYLGRAGEKVDNWNEHLPTDWSKDMNLLYGFHNLYDHTWFSLYDFIFVREFEQNYEIYIER